MKNYLFKIYFGDYNKYLKNELSVYALGKINAYLLAVASRIKEGKEYQSAEKIEMYENMHDDFPHTTTEINDDFKKSVMNAL